MDFSIPFEAPPSAMQGPEPSLEQVSVAVCDSTAFEPACRCFGAPQAETPRALDYERGNFAAEWQLQITLGRDPALVRGDSPPWLN